MDRAEREQLTTFLDEFAALIDRVLNDHPDWFPDKLRNPLGDTWRSDIKPAIDRIKSAIDSGEFDSRLRDEGLAGRQLALKMAAWDHAHTAVSVSQPPRGWLDRLLRRIVGILRPFQGALKIANAVLESIGKVIPPAGAVKEFKDILEGSLDLHEPGQGFLKNSANRIRRRLGRPKT